MAPVPTNQPVPGAWVARAQAALDELAEMTTAEQVVHRFGGARALVGEVLGTPDVGGTGTRRSVRATGALLVHRLGPALAAEALSWAASVTGSVSPSTIERFLEDAADTEVVHRPVRLDDRHVLAGHLDRCRTEATRHTTLRRMWGWVPEAVSERPLPGLEADPTPGFAYFDPTDDPWLEATAEPERAHPVADDVIGAASDTAQIEAFDDLPPWERWQLAGSPALFGLTDEVVARSLLEQPAAVLSNPACPPGLRSRVRHPYDLATLELALRAGSSFYEVARVRRLLGDLDPATHRRLLRDLRLPYLRAMRICGHATAAALLSGPLAHLDLADRATAEAVLGTQGDWRWRRIPADVVEVLVHHPHAAHLAWTLQGHPPGAVPGDVALRLTTEAGPAVARAALGHVPTHLLEAVHAGVSIAAGPYWAARCPGIPGSRRPVRGGYTTSPWWAEAHAEDRPMGPRHAFAYPAEIRDLEGTYEEAPGWTVRLPRTPADLERNAILMQNCTRSFGSAIASGETCILIVESPDGTRYNAAVVRTTRRRGPRWQVGEVNSPGNSGHRPAWIAPAVNTRLAHRVPAPEVLEPAHPGRRPSSHRDRRRARARRARRLRR